MRVLHLYAGNLYGGVETLLATLAREQHACPALVPEFGLCFEGRLNSELLSAGATVHRLGEVRFGLPWTVWLARRRLRRLLSESSPDAVVTHSCWPHAVFAPAVRKTGIPLLFWPHDYLDQDHWLTRRASLTAPDRIIAISHCTAGDAIKLFPGVPVEVMYYPVRPSSGDRSKRESIREETKTRQDAVVILIACRLEERKGHAFLLEALGALRDNPRWICWVVGGVQRPQEELYLEGLHKQAAMLDLSERIRWLGERSDVPNLMAAADIHCQPNLRPEPFGIVFVEALYSGRPAVSFRHGGAAEIIDDSCGLLVEPKNAVELSHALAQLIDNPELRGRLGDRGPARALELCNPATQMGKLLKMIGDLKQKRS